MDHRNQSNKCKERVSSTIASHVVEAISLQYPYHVYTIKYSKVFQLHELNTIYCIDVTFAYVQSFPLKNPKKPR